MSQVAATMGYTVDELNDSTSEASQNFSQLREFAMEMGANTAFSASQAADALNYMALAGYDAETSMTIATFLFVDFSNLHDHAAECSEPCGSGRH